MLSVQLIRPLYGQCTKKGAGNDKQGKDVGNRTLCPYRNFNQAINDDTVTQRTTFVSCNTMFTSHFYYPWSCTIVPWRCHYTPILHCLGNVTSWNIHLYSCIKYLLFTSHYIKYLSFTSFWIYVSQLKQNLDLKIAPLARTELWYDITDWSIQCSL